MNTENNKIIAEFMGNYLLKNHQGGYDEMIKKFSSDWNWLMQVVEKIRSIDSKAKGDFRVKLLHYQRNNKTIFDLSILEGKEHVYQACSEFVKWYNLAKEK